ncbi:uncharacterized protein LOC141807788 [Halichoeres trimaculatus]|uniref:uncharacterized protein LOC141807788 n=1 Tax=Halichoeres trimaculatus TaxID=147232 RepID=UPI003D9F10AD
MEDAEMTDTSKNGYRQFTNDGELQDSVTDGSLRNNPFRVATVCLGILCAVLLVGVIAQGVQQQKSEEDFIVKITGLKREKVDLQENLKAVHAKKTYLEYNRDQYMDINKYSTQEAENLQNSNNFLTEETNNLKASQSQLEASKATLSGETEQLKATQYQLQVNNKALTKDKELLQKQHDLVLKRKKELHASLDSVTKERDELKTKISNASRSKDELITSHQNLKKDIAQFRERWVSAAAEMDKIAVSHMNLTAEKALLLEATEVLKKSIAELEKAFGRYENEQQELKTKCKIVEQEKEKFQQQNNNVTAEKDRLQEEIQRLNATVDGNKCANGWRKFENSCYFTSVLKKTWNRAREFCKARGADLATIKSQDQMDFINGLYGSDQEVWIGLSDEGVEGQWRWVDGTPLATAFWGKGQPNSHKGKEQDCVEFWHRASGSGEWNDESCDIVQNFICQK